MLSNQECTDERVDVWEIPANFDWDEEPPFGTMPLPLRHYYYDSSSPSMDHQNQNEHLEQSSCLVKFLLQVCTNPSLWCA